MPRADELHCVHGTYIGGPCGPDYLCWLCEDGHTATCPACRRPYHLVKERECAACGRDAHGHEANATDRELRATIQAYALQCSDTTPHNAHVREQWAAEGEQHMAAAAFHRRALAAVNLRCKRHNVNQ